MIFQRTILFWISHWNRYSTFWAGEQELFALRKNIIVSQGELFDASVGFTHRYNKVMLEYTVRSLAMHFCFYMSIISFLSKPMNISFATRTLSDLLLAPISEFEIEKVNRISLTLFVVRRESPCGCFCLLPQTFEEVMRNYEWYFVSLWVQFD